MSVKEKDPQPSDRSWRSLLLSRPVRNTAAETQRGGDGLLRVTVRSKKPWFMLPPLTWFINPRYRKTYTLDKLGTEVWDLCNGDRTVEDVVDEFASVHRLTFHEARASVTGYMSELVRRGAIAIAM